MAKCKDPCTKENPCFDCVYKASFTPEQEKTLEEFSAHVEEYKPAACKDIACMVLCCTCNNKPPGFDCPDIDGCADYQTGRCS